MGLKLWQVIIISGLNGIFILGLGFINILLNKN
jgi:hypothetical protein